MTGELEAAAADSITDAFRPRKKRPFDRQGEPCANCAAPLEGWYCYSCGQNADTHHRTILHLIWEAIEGMFHLDGRLARTLPLMFFRPGVLAKDYMEGRIARHVPPFRTFLVALLLFIFAAEHAIHNLKHHVEEQNHERAAVLATPQGRLSEANKLRADALRVR
ncbi:3'-5' exonuclease, partial [Pseudomonas sp. HMWF010]